MNEQEQLALYGYRHILAPIGLIQCVFIIVLLCSPFVWYWHSWDLAWKLGATGLTGILVMYIIYNFFKKVILDEFKEDE